MMKRRACISSFASVIIISGCMDNPTRNTYIKIKKEDSPEKQTKVAPYSCIQKSNNLQSIVDEAIEEGYARKKISESERDEMVSTLQSCFESENGQAYIRHKDEFYRVTFLEEQ